MKDDCLAVYRERINAFLESCLPALDVIPAQLHQAMRYVVLGGGKRVRAALVYAVGEAFGVTLEKLDEVAAAVELVHAYSLVHDDLPAMDDDDLRHGKLTCHKAFDEATAILVGDALQALAFERLTLAGKGMAAEICLQMINILAAAVGSTGMAGGQALDLAAEDKQIDVTELEAIHVRKTGALIVASVQMGALAAGCEAMQVEKLKLFAQAIGLAFQVQDDIIDIESHTEILGKRQGADLIKRKATYPLLLGMADAKAKASALYEKALAYLAQLNLEKTNLRDIAQLIVQRNC